MITLYTVDGCPKCENLANMLTEKGVEFKRVVGEDAIIEKGLTSAPILEVDMLFPEAFNYVKGLANGKAR